MNREELIKAMQTVAEEKPRAVKVKGWGTVYVKHLTVAEVESQQEDTADKKDKHRLARAAARVICDEKGTRLFNPEDEADVNLIASQPWPALRMILREDLEDEPGK